MIDGIDLDNEDLLTPEPTRPQPQAKFIQFAKILGEAGFSATFCVYNNPDFWSTCLKSISSTNPGLVTEYNLQCYDGGQANTPAEWIKSISNIPNLNPNGFIMPGFWTTNKAKPDCGRTPQQIVDLMQEWEKINSAYQPNGGFIWNYQDAGSALNNYASSLVITPTVVQ